MGISKKMQLEEMDRVSLLEYDEDGRAKNDDAAFCAHENYVSDMMREQNIERVMKSIVLAKNKGEKN